MPRRAATATSVFASPSYHANPYPVFAELRTEAPATRTTLPNGTEVFVVTRYADVEAALKDARLIKNITSARGRPSGLLGRLGFAQYFGNSNMLKADPPEHTRLRGLVSKAFTPKLINQMRGDIQALADRLLDAVEPAGKMDLIADFAFPLPITVITRLLGVPSADEGKFRRWSSSLVASGALSSESLPLEPSLFQLVRYVRKLIRQRRASGGAGDDLIGQLMSAQEEGQSLSDRELLSTLILLLIAGHETTVNLIGNGMLALLLAPDQLHQLRDDPARIRGAVEELLRFVNPVQLVNRYAAEDLDIGGVAIPRGTHLLLLIASGNHDAAFIPDGDQLDVTRTVRQHLAFSQGIHYCLGAPLARLEGEIAFTTLLRRLPNIRLAVAPDQLEWRPGLELRGLQALPVVF
ncbi:MAG: cytochrome P450 [Chloroflexi bacterium]|nr:cytochrome P450 [Chloroflexota bacterium]